MSQVNSSPRHAGPGTSPAGPSSVPTLAPGAVWVRTRATVRRFMTPTQPRAPWPAILVAALGGALTIAVLSLTGNATGTPILIAAFGSSCVLVFLLPDAPLSQPVNVVGGHMVSALCGVAAHAFLPTAWWSLGLSVGAAMAAMAALRIIHPPAGGTPIAILLAHEGWGYLLTPVLAGSLILTACALLYRVLLRDRAAH
ncbi:HPP family protein [Paenarthrobacter sp. DKR-5]|uniref:HPP family protein n=1 Tax=Paenarthrobacter sp. DKR-5 TaxID=2835535 RepID=UPI001BDD122E|nr:HPP family protein [Paenarthrobacter sp. DKR-5]MBT1003880.1 HPP family protein [Paenarthrobacter sp. DKR-5]